MGYEAEVPAKTLFFYEFTPLITKFVRDLKPNLVWLEFRDYREYLQAIDALKGVTDMNNVFVVCRDMNCVRCVEGSGVNVVYDLDLTLKQYVRMFIRVKVDGKVREVIHEGKVFTPKDELYSYDEVLVK